jgi:hypothetical protein
MPINQSCCSMLPHHSCEVTCGFPVKCMHLPHRPVPQSSEHATLQAWLHLELGQGNQAFLYRTYVMWPC